MAPWGLGLLPGVSDFILLLPEGRMVFVEAKTPEGVLNRSQARFRGAVTALGFDYQIVRSLDDYIALLKSYGVELLLAR